MRFLNYLAALFFFILGIAAFVYGIHSLLQFHSLAGKFTHEQSNFMAALVITFIGVASGLQGLVMLSDLKSDRT
jgi:ABC-type transport system involved in cytochrome c biogenesis permease subunit